jgi:hypothetical protein
LIRISSARPTGVMAALPLGFPCLSATGKRRAMVTFTMSHEIAGSVDTFWKMFFDKVLLERLFKDLKFPKWVVVEERDTETEIHRTIDGIPKMDVPAAFAKFFGPGFGYLETGVYDKKTRVYRFKMKMNSLTDKLRLEGTVRAEPDGENRCRRVVEITAEAKLFGVGGVIEGLLEKGFRDGWAESARYFSAKAQTYPA